MEALVAAEEEMAVTMEIDTSPGAGSEAGGALEMILEILVIQVQKLVAEHQAEEE
jgi:hypothetical protein